MLGKLLQGRYQIIQVLSVGKFYHTYLAQDTCQKSRPTYIVKHLVPSTEHSESLPTLRRLFTREAEALEKLGNYDRVPELIAYFEENEEFYLVQEFILGHPLSVELEPNRHWSENQVVQLLQEILSILEAIHSHGLIHRDIKPSNLIRRQRNSKLVLIDFGSVKQAWTQVVTTQGQTSASFAIDIPTRMDIGTLGYMPIEQERGRPRPSSDIYAVGMICIQALTGLDPEQLPENALTREVNWEQYATVSPQLAAVLSKMVRYHFHERYQAATEVLQALQPMIAHLGLSGTNKSLVHQKTLEATVDSFESVAPLTHKTSVGLLQRSASNGGHINRKTHDATPVRKSVLLGVGVGFICAVASIVGLYYFLRPPASAPLLQQQPAPRQGQNNTVGNIAPAKTLTGHSDVVWSVALNPNQQTFASSSGDKTIKIWSLPAGELERTLSGHAGTVWSIALSPNGQTLASGSSDSTIKLWNVNSGTPLWTLFGHSDAIRSIEFSPDGQMLATSSLDKTIKLWNLSSGKLLGTLSGHSNAVRSIVFTPDGQSLISGSSDNKIKIWNLSSGVALHTLSGHADRVLALAVSHDGRLLVSGSVDKTIKIWNLSDGKLLRTLSGNSDWINAVAISPDGQLLASGVGPTIKIWDLNTFKPLYTLSGHKGDVTSIFLRDNGREIISGSKDKTIKMWQL